MKGRQPAFWVAVGGVSILSQVLFNLAADRLNIPALTTLNAYATRKNG